MSGRIIKSIVAKTRPVVAVNLADYRNIHQKQLAAAQLRPTVNPVSAGYLIDAQMLPKNFTSV